MTGTLKVDTAKLTSTADEFKSIGNDIKSLTDSMTDTVKQLNQEGVWSGDAATAYANKFNGLNDDIARMIKMVNEHVDDLKEMARQYETTEQSNQDLASELLDEVIE